jgi:hypothetical protein
LKYSTSCSVWFAPSGDREPVDNWKWVDDDDACRFFRAGRFGSQHLQIPVCLQVQGFKRDWTDRQLMRTQEYGSGPTTPLSSTHRVLRKSGQSLDRRVDLVNIPQPIRERGRTSRLPLPRLNILNLLERCSRATRAGRRSSFLRRHSGYRPTPADTLLVSFAPDMQDGDVRCCAQNCSSACPCSTDIASLACPSS